MPYFKNAYRKVIGKKELAWVTFLKKTNQLGNLLNILDFLRLNMTFSKTK